MLVVRLKSVIPADAIPVQTTKGFIFYVSPEDEYRVKQIYWRAVKSSSGYYARARYQKDGKTVTIRMHRFVMNTPPGQKCHHKNHNRFDNTRGNLENQTEREHRHTDGWHFFEH